MTKPVSETRRRDKKLVVNATCQFPLIRVAPEYEIATTTADTDSASTVENVWVVLEGRKARSKEFVLENKKKKFLR